MVAGSRARPRRRTRGRLLVLGVVAVVLGAFGAVVLPTPAEAAGTVLFENGFHNNTVDGTGTVTVPTSSSGANAACLTARGNTTIGPLVSCAGNIDTAGNGKLRLTNSSTNQVGGVFGQTSFPTSNGLDVTFTSYQWGGGSADGLGFLLAAVDPANPTSPTTIGPSGGSLGYSPAGSVRGLTNAYLGVGLDVFGNFSATGFQGTGCTNVLNITNQTPGAAVVRGPGNGLVGYCGLATTFTGSGKIALRAATRAASAVPVQVLINPTSSSFTSDSGVSVAAGTYKVVVKPVGQSTKTLSGPLPAASPALYPSATWLNASGVPKQLAFAFVGSTGSVTDAHEIDDVKVLTFNPVPQLEVASTSYSAPTSTPGDPVTYQVAAQVLPGADESSPVSVTQTVPVGVVPVGAYGSGWVCATAVGRSITCTTSASGFPAGTTLPTITVVAIVTGASVTDAFVQANSPSSVTSADANPATTPTTSAGTRPGAPTGMAVNPAIGPVSGGNTVIGSGSSTEAPSAIFIGTTAEQQAGTPVVLLPCTAGRAPGCFNIEGSSLAIGSMPARASAATVRVTAVLRGIAGFTTYVYASSPTVPATPTASAGISSATLSWVAPAANGSPITSYVVTPYLGGVAQPTQTFSGSTTSTTFTGLAAGSSWTYTVAAVNAYGTSAASAKSTAVVPYVLPGAPTITAAAAGDSSATLTWSTPSNGGNAITAYVVTPYLGTVAQATRTFGTATTQVVTGLTPGAAYTFTVAATNAAGTGPPSAKSSVVVPNSSPSLSFPDPPAGEVGVAYSRQLTVTDGTAPFVWTVTVGSLPAGLTLNASSGMLSGTPTVAGSTTFTVRVTDASNETATRPVTLVIAAAPSIAFNPAAGEVGVAYSQQPVLSGGTAPFSWAISSGSLPAGLGINATTGLVSGTPTASGSFSLTVSATDSFSQVASKTVTIVVVARPAFSATAPPNGQVGVAYSTTFAVTGGSLPLTWSISAGSAPPGLSLNASTGVLSGTPSATGTSSFSVGVTDANNQTATKAVTIVISAGPLVILKVADASSTVAGGTVGYTVTVRNTGSSSFANVNLGDSLSGVLDDADYQDDATATSGTVSYAAPTLTWNGSIAAGATVTIEYSVTVDNPDVGNKVLANTVTSSTLGTNCASGSGDARCASTVTVAGLTIVNSADVPSTTPGGTVSYQVVVTNTAPVPATGATFTDDLSGILDDATYAADALATSGNVSFASTTLTWTGTLAAGASATVTFSAVVRDPDPGNRSLTSTVVSSSPGSSCPSGNAAASCTSTVPVLVPALVITNAASVSTTTPGDTVPYTVTISNTGQTPFTGASVSVALAAALDDATYDANAAATVGTVGFSAGSLTWSGNLATGAVATITYSLTVHDPDPGNRTLTTVATSSAAGSTCSPGNPSGACTSTVEVLVPGLTISAATNVSTTTPGSVVAYTVVATNTGQTPYPSANFTTSMSAALDDATYNGDAEATAGAVAFTSPNLTWTGALAIGATVTVTFTVTVRQPDPGNRSLVTTTSSTTGGSNCPAASSDPACSTTVDVLLPGLSFASAADTVTTTPGSVVHYTLTVTNTGETTQQDVVVVVDLVALFDDATYNNDALVSTGTQTANPDGTSSWTLTLAPGASATTTVSMTVNDPDEGDRVLRTLVSSEAAGSTCPLGSPNPACRTTVTVLVPGLTITKVADKATTTPGDSVVYTVTALNNGETTFPAATFTDDLTDVLTDAAYQGDATATSGTFSYSSPTLSWTGALAPGASATIRYSVTVSDPGFGDKQMSNVVVSTSKGSNCAVGSTDPRCRTAVHVDVPKLTLVTTADRATTAPGETVGYTVTVTNTGATAYTDATFVESLAGVLDDATFVAGSESATTGTPSYTAPTLTWTGDLAIGASATITFSVLVHTDDGGNNRLTGVTTSTTPGNNCASGGSDPRCAATVPVARLVLAYGYTAPTVAPGGIVYFSATYTNTGQVPYTGISVASLGEGAADDGLPGGDQTASSGILTVGGTGALWTGDIPVGGHVDLTATMGVQDPDLGDGIIFVTMESSASGNNCLPGSVDPRCALTVTVLTPALSITKTANTTATVPGGTVGYTITVNNTGETSYAGAVVSDTLVGVLDDATYNSNAVATTGSVDYTSPILTWTGDLAPGATATITYSVTARSPEPGDKTMANPVSSNAAGSTCPPGGGAPACHTTVVVLTPALTILKTADHATTTLDSTVTYTVKATNSGQTSFPAAAFSDSLAGVLDDAAYNPAATTATSGSVGYAAGVLTWSGALAPGSSATITYTVTVSNPDTGNHTLTNTVTSTTTGNNCVAGSGDARCTATVVVTDEVSLTLTKTSDVPATTAGGVVSYTLTAVNASGAAIDANLTDPLTGVLDDATWNDDLVVSSGSGTFTSPNVTWSGSVPAAGTVTVTYSVTVRPIGSGNGILEGRLTSTLPGASNNCLAASIDPRCATSVLVAGLTIQQAYTETSTTPGSLLHLSATFTNTGQMPYTGITISSASADTIDDAVPTGDQTASSGVLVLSATAITWTGDIPVGGTVTIQGTLTVKNPDPGNLLITGTLVSSALGNNCPSGGTDVRCKASVPVLLPGLTVQKVASATTAVPGSIVGYTITVANTGQTAYSPATVTDPMLGVLDDATFNSDAGTTRGTVGYSNSVLTWTGALAPGESATITYSVTVKAQAAGDKTMVNPVSSTDVGSTCRPSSGSPACNSLVVVLTPSLLITSSVNKVTTQPGATVTYTVTATNNGQTYYPDAELDVPLAGVLDDATSSGSPTATIGSATLAGSTLSWVGALVPGDTATVTYDVVVKAAPAGDFRLAQTVASITAGSNCAASGTDPRCSTSVPIASLLIVNNADVATTYPTGVVRNTATITNIGQVPYVDAVVNASFVGSLDDATYNGDAAATSGTLLLVTGTGQVRWTGDLAPGEVATVTGSLTVNNPPAGNRNLSTRVTTDAVGSNCPVVGGADVCATSVPVLMPQLTITKTANVSVAGPGSTVAYTITATNTGETDYVDATVSDPLEGLVNDAAFNAGSVAVTSGSIGYADEVLTWTGDLAVDEVVTITFTATVQDPYLGDGTLVNRAVSDELGSTCPTGAAAPACLSVVPVLVPALDITVSADRSTTVPGGTVGYTVTVHNDGQTDYVNATVTTSLAGVLDDATITGTPSTSTGAVVLTATNLTWTGDLLVGATATFTYSVTVADPDVGDKLLVTSVSSSAAGSTCGTAAQCSNSVTVLIPGLAVSTSADVATATPGDPVTFTTVLTNTGQTAYVGTVATSDLSDVIDDASLEGDATASAGVVTYTAPGLTWTGSLPVGATATISYTVRVDNPDTGDRSLSATVVAAAQGSTCPTATGNAACTATVSVLIPKLSITKTAGTATTTPGSVVAYTIVVTNTGQTAYAAAHLDDSLSGVLPDSDYNRDAVVVGGGTLGYTEPTLSWTGALPIGAIATITYSITVDDPDPGDKHMVNTVVSSSPGSTCPPSSPGAACTAAVDVLVPALVVTKHADTTTVVAGSAVQYTITVANTGQTAYAPAVVTDSLAGVLDDASYDLNAIADVGSVDDSTDTLVWTGPLALGQTATITYSVTADFPASGDRSLANTAQSSSPGSNCVTAADPRCTSTVAVVIPALVITKAADVTEVVAGGVVSYTVTATNTGAADYPEATFVDSLGDVLDDATFNDDASASAGAVVYADGTLTWNGSLPVGAIATISYSVTTDIAAAEGAVLTNAVVSGSVGSTCPAGGSDPACSTTTSVAARSIELSGLDTSFTLTGPPHTTVTGEGAVTMTVTTNVVAGYSVSVLATTDSLVGSLPGNTDVIPLALLEVRETGTVDFLGLSMNTYTVVHVRQTASGAGGDAVSNDYQIQMPNVMPDTYSTTLNYIVAAH
jgi:large repetitive protein